MKKFVSGVGLVDMTAEEEAAHIAQQEAIAAERAAYVPAAVTPLQLRRALRAAGLHTQIAAALVELGEEAQEAWEYAVTIPRGDPMIAGAATAINLTSEQVDELFRAAAAL